MGKRSAGFVILRPFEGETRCLLLRCFRYWDFPKGEVEPGEDPLQTARREAAEETDLKDLDLRWGDGFIETNPYAGGKVARYYLAESRAGAVRLPVSPELGHPEHHEYRWVELDEAPTLLVPRLQAVLTWARQRIETSRRSLSMHDGIAVWCDCCSCEAEPYWVEIGREMGIEPGSDYEDPESRGPD
jgi:bis(5'-nucleosidyl)-tetraphosphatase